MGDLEYLSKEAFEFTLEVNPGAGSYTPISQILEERDPGDDDWVSIDQKDEAIRTNKLCVGQVYPNGSVSFFTVYGTDVMTVVRECARLCREDKARYAAAKP